MKPDILISLVVDPVSGAAAFRPAVEQGSKLVLISNLPSGFEHGKDYAGIVTDDLSQMGKSRRISSRMRWMKKAKSVSFTTKPTIT